MKSNRIYKIVEILNTKFVLVQKYNRLGSDLIEPNFFEFQGYAGCGILKKNENLEQFLKRKKKAIQDFEVENQEFISKYKN